MSIVQDAEEVFGFHDFEGLLLCLALDVLLIDDILEELNSGHIVIQDVQHEHHHDLQRLVVQFAKVERLLFLFLFLGLLLVW